MLLMGNTRRVRYTHRLAECGPLTSVQGMSRPLLLPFVADLDYGTGYTYGIRLDVNELGAVGLRALEVRAQGSAADVTGTTLRGIRINELVLDAMRVLADASREADEWGAPSAGGETTSITDPPAWIRERQALSLIEDAFPDLLVDDTGRLRASPEEVAEMRRHGPSSDFTASRVGALYRLASESGTAPVRFLADVLDIPQSTSSHWVKIARAAGVIAPTTRRPRAGQAHAGTHGDD